MVTDVFARAFASAANPFEAARMGLSLENLDGIRLPHGASSDRDDKQKEKESARRYFIQSLIDQQFRDSYAHIAAYEETERFIARAIRRQEQDLTNVNQDIAFKEQRIDAQEQRKQQLEEGIETTRADMSTAQIEKDQTSRALEESQKNLERGQKIHEAVKQERAEIEEQKQEAEDLLSDAKANEIKPDNDPDAKLRVDENGKYIIVSSDGQTRQPGFFENMKYNVSAFFGATTADDVEAQHQVVEDVKQKHDFVCDKENKICIRLDSLSEQHRQLYDRHTKINERITDYAQRLEDQAKELDAVDKRLLEDRKELDAHIQKRAEIEKNLRETREYQEKFGSDETKYKLMTGEVSLDDLRADMPEGLQAERQKYLAQREAEKAQGPQNDERRPASPAVAGPAGPSGP